MEIINGIRETAEPEAEQLKDCIGKNIKIHGSIYKIRKMSGFEFVILRTKRKLVQCVYTGSTANSDSQELREEMCVEVYANVVSEERSREGFELHITGLRVLSSPAKEASVVINNKRVDASLETLLDYRPLTLRNEKQRAVFKVQEGICSGFRSFLTKNRFTEIHTPKIVSEGAEGGANIFRLDYFGKEAYLAQSPQFYKQMMVGVFERVYEIAPVFRAEHHDTSRHLNEYTGVDFEMGYIESFYDIMAMEEAMIRDTMGWLKESCKEELTLLKAELPAVDGIPALRFQEAKEMVAAANGREITDFFDFEPEEERMLSGLIKKKTGSDFVFVTHYPSRKRPFYAMDNPDNSEETLSFDLLFRGMEITTGGQRIHAWREQVEKMEQRGMDTVAFESYLMAHKYGLPPHGGLGLGLERFTARLLQLDNVRLSALFPRDISRVTP